MINAFKLMSYERCQFSLTSSKLKRLHHQTQQHSLNNPERKRMGVVLAIHYLCYRLCHPRRLHFAREHQPIQYPDGEQMYLFPVVVRTVAQDSQRVYSRTERQR